MKAVFTVPYKEGSLRAEGVADGKVMETKTLATAGTAVGIRLSADRKELKADKNDMSFIIIELVDTKGRQVPVADNLLKVTVEGNAALQALGNADIKDEDPYFDNTHKAWKGRALAVVVSLIHM